MTTEAILAALGIYAGTFAIAAISSVLPFVLIDVFLIAVASTANPVLLVVCAALGQLVGKLPIYAAARAAGTLPASRRFQTWIERFRAAPHLVLFASAVLGLPPFSLMSTTAGVLAVKTRPFCAIVFVGRALRFTIVVALAR